jgi:hypothetical protein
MALLVAIAATTVGLAAPAGADRPQRMDVEAGPQMGNVPTHDAKPNRGGQSPNMTYHGGSVMTTYTAQPIFWGKSWGSYTGDKMTGMDTWYKGFSGSNYATTSDEYSGSNGQVGPTGTSSTHWVDTSAAPSGAPSTGTILSEVAAQLQANSTPPVASGYYPVYVDTKRGRTGYCAWHSWGSIGGVPVQFAFFFNLDGDPGCDPQDNSGGPHSQGLAAIANVSGHELSEARTDPRGNGWFDQQGAENGDKCAWTFGAQLLTFPDGSQWKIQGEWSNAAYSAKTGYPNSSGQPGCLGTL